ncbi:MAG: endonuclease/exonuclease/phosphatase family protein, partial [Jatrophihabitans sp.]
MTLTILTLNLSNPSHARAQKQIDWLAEQDADVFVLTETKASAGCAYIAEQYRSAGYCLVDSAPAAGEYGVLVAARVQLTLRTLPLTADYLSSRMVRAVCPTLAGQLELCGVYAPATDPTRAPTVEARERKRRWLKQLRETLQQAEPSLLLVGDYNVFPRTDGSDTGYIQDFEYDFFDELAAELDLHDCHRTVGAFTWQHHAGARFRYDHTFASPTALHRVTACDYLQAPRELKLTDHAAMRTSLSLEPADRLEVAGLATAHTGPTLF